MKKNTTIIFTLLLVCSISAQAQRAIELADSATNKAMNGNWDDVIVLYNKSLELNPDMAEAYHNRGLTYSFLGNDSAAIADFSKTILLIPNLPNVELSYANRSNIFFKHQHYEDAAADFKKAIEINPHSYLIYNKLALCYLNLEIDSLAMACLDSSLSINPDFKETYFYNGVFYMQKNQDLKAIENFDKAIAIDSAYESAYFQRGMAKVGLDLYNEAISDFDKVISLSGENAACYLSRGLAYAFLLDSKKACEDFENAKKFGEPEKADELIGKFCK
jgi:tetratricopeptide (TPR) repeat protein